MNTEHDKYHALTIYIRFEDVREVITSSNYIKWIRFLPQ